jgi:hypothetical protein
VRRHRPQSRRARSLFIYTRCQHTTHADIGAATNIKNHALTHTSI